MPAKRKAVKTVKSSNAAADQAIDAIGSDDHQLMISEAAYYRALERGFEGGTAEDDWYAAEAEIRKVFRQL